MTWDELVAEFCALGGVAENVRLGVGKFGRGIFAVDPSKPVTLHAPETMLVPADQFEVRDGQIRVADSATIGERERAFVEAYHRHFTWGAGLFEEFWRLQEAWHRLPADVEDFIRRMGASKDIARCFLAPSAELCFFKFVRTRDYSYHAKAYMAPVIDLVNHSTAAPIFVVENGVGVAGTFSDEVLARYNARDPWWNALSYGFSDPGGFAYSLAISVDVDGRHRIVIERDITANDVIGGISFPRASSADGAFVLPYLTLGSTAGPDLPRGVFRKLAVPPLTPDDADKAFDGIAQFNRRKFLDLLTLLRKHDGEVVRMLETAAIHQLGTLSDCVGARDLSAIELPH